MTRESLQQLRALKCEIEHAKARLRRIETDYGRYGTNAAAKKEIKRLESSVNESVIEALQKENEIMDWIIGIPNSLARDVISLRYLDGYSWSAVAVRIGGGNTPDSVRKIAERYIND